MTAPSRLAELAALACLASACAAPEIAIEPRYAQVDVGGTLGLSSGSLAARNELDDLGVRRDDGTGGVRADFKWGGPHLTLDLQASNHDGDGRLSEDLSQGGVTIPSGTAVSTDFDLGLQTLYLTFDLIPGDFELGLGLGVVAVDLDFRITDPLSGMSISSDEALPLPVVAGRAGVELGPVDLEALVGAMAYRDGSTDVTIFDGHASGRYRILGGGDRMIGSLVAGVRYVLIDAEYSDGGDEVAGDLEILGPFAGLRLQF